MTVLVTGAGLPEELETLERNREDFDFFHLRVKKSDRDGEGGDFDRKVALIEDVDRHLSRLLEREPDEWVVTGDHSAPVPLHSRSGHPVPVIVHAPRCRPNPVERFGESACLGGGPGPMFAARDLLPPALANALRMKKDGA